MLAILSVLPLLAVAPVPQPALAAREYAFDLWDWTPPCRDLSKFRQWADDLKRIGFTHLEISAPWNRLEPRPGEYDLSFVADRLAVAREHGLGLRVRINSYYAGATPAWLECDRWRDAQGAEPFRIPSINDERFWARFGPLCTAIARRFRGLGILYSPFIGVHAELKWSEWWSYDPSSMALWRRSVSGSRPQWLRRVVGDSPLPETPPSPPPDTSGRPDSSAHSIALIAFREQSWREAVRRFARAIHDGDPGACVSAPLGESYRRQSAQMSNLDYWGLTRGAGQVVHSYDFFWHAGQEPWYAGASVAAFQGITGLPVSFEFDGPNLFDPLGYTESGLLAIGDAALAAGAGIKVANYSYSERLPSSWPFLVEMGKRVAAANARPADQAPKGRTVLLFVSKWANYGYRESVEWLHDAQFGAWKMLRERGFPVRFICEDNLTEDLRGYRGLYAAFSPPDLMPEEDRQRLKTLSSELPSVVEVPGTPPLAQDGPLPEGLGPDGAFPVTAPGLPVAPCPAQPSDRGVEARWNGQPLLWSKGPRVLAGFPLAYVWLRGADRPAMDRLLDRALKVLGP